MIEKLIKLSDYLDNKNFIIESNYLDELIRKYSEKMSFPAAGAYAGNWNDTDISFSSSDLNVTEDAQLFVLIVDKAAELLGFSEPIVTSGLRPPRRQVEAMLGLWKGNGGPQGVADGLSGDDNPGSKYIINLYSGCASCHPEAGEIAKKLVLVWEEYSQPPDHRYAIKPEGVDISAKIVKDEGGISSHQDGQAIDYGLISNSNEEISKILQYVINNNLASLDPIDERRMDLPEEERKEAAPHWHITVLGVTQAGRNFLSTPNSEIKPPDSLNPFGEESEEAGEIEIPPREYEDSTPGDTLTEKLAHNIKDDETECEKDLDEEVYYFENLSGMLKDIEQENDSYDMEDT